MTVTQVEPVTAKGRPPAVIVSMQGSGGLAMRMVMSVGDVVSAVNMLTSALNVLADQAGKTEGGIVIP